MYYVLGVIGLINIYLLRFTVLTQLTLIRNTKVFSLNINIIMIISIFLMLKLLVCRNHFLGYLITIEVFIVITYVRVLYEVRYLSSSTALLFILIVVMVAGACVGMSLLVVVTRMISKELELRLTMM